jgi:hypothetical protein
MFEYRKIYLTEDRYAVVDLLRKNLDKRITENFFIWKHLENPFGISTGIVALENNRIIGVKMLMKWEFKKGEQVVKALRPVDTAVDINYRGKGVFSRMNKFLQNEFNTSINLIFNTPNAKSLIPNLQSGWSDLETRLYFRIGIVIPRKKKAQVKEVSKSKINLQSYKNNSSYLLTNTNDAFLNWRYRDSEYRCMEINLESHKGYIFFKISRKHSINFLIIYQIIGKNEYYSKFVDALCFKLKCFLVYYLENPYLKSLNCLIKIRRKPINVLYNELGVSKLKNKLIFSLGDLDGKL